MPHAMLWFVVFSDFKVGDFLSVKLDQAQRDYQALSDTVDFATMEYFDLNKDSVKKHKLSPDAVMQMAIQVKPG